MIAGLVQLRRELRVPELGATRRYASLSRPGLRIYAFDLEGMVFDSRALPPRTRALVVGRPVSGHICVPLAGSYVARREGAQTAVERRGIWIDEASILDERWEGAPFRALCVEWDPRFGEPCTTQEGRLGEGDAGRLDTVARALLSGDVTERDVAVAFQVLSGVGLDTHEAFEAACRDAAPSRAHLLAGAIGGSLSALDRHPDLTDLERTVGLGARQIRRQLHDLGEWSPIPRGDWRGKLRTLRVRLASTLATARGASVETIARSLGYRSPQALLLALRQEGAPSPARTRAIVHGHAAR